MYKYKEYVQNVDIILENLLQISDSEILTMTAVLCVTQFQEWIQNSLNHLHFIPGSQLREKCFHK